MGSNLMLVTLEIGKDQEPAWPAARAALTALPRETLVRLYKAIQEKTDPTGDDLADVRNGLEDGLTLLQTFWECPGHFSTVHDLKNSRVLIFGGDFWGEGASDGWNSACLAIDAGLAAAAGFWSAGSQAALPR